MATTGLPIAALTTLVVYKQVAGPAASTGTFSLVRQGDGSYKFTDSNSVVRFIQSNENFDKLFDEINALT